MFAVPLPNLCRGFGAALLGALAGGAFTILGSWLQARSSNIAAALAQAQANAQRGFDTLTQLKVHLEAQTFQGTGSEESRAAWNRERETLTTTANSTIMLLPDKYKETRDRVLMLLRMIKRWEGLPAWPEYKVATSLLLSEALKFLGLFVRGSDVPEKRDMTEVIARDIEHYRRQEAHRELESLERDAEHSGLDEEDMQRARDLREFLGEHHPPEITGASADTPS
ncbi:hypothetical protein ACFQ0X_43290 [Streptomyces rectiviolaceus]|uniref:Uncharacterized protein n=1 Tax=Streptomyces rectiviolaceus TaxID=332591 RepID=A0ABP6MI56_9ACTN